MTDIRCLSSAPMPFKDPQIKRCELNAHHKGYHQWSETAEGHDRVPVIVIWDEHKCTKIVQGEA